MWISETYLDSCFPDGDLRLNLTSYNLFRVDNTENIKRGGACVYFKESLVAYLVTFPYLKEYLFSQDLIQIKL